MTKYRRLETGDRIHLHTTAHSNIILHTTHTAQNASLHTTAHSILQQRIATLRARERARPTLLTTELTNSRPGSSIPFHSFAICPVSPASARSHTHSSIALYSYSIPVPLASHIHMIIHSFISYFISISVSIHFHVASAFCMRCAASFLSSASCSLIRRYHTACASSFQLPTQPPAIPVLSPPRFFSLPNPLSVSFPCTLFCCEFCRFCVYVLLFLRWTGCVYVQIITNEENNCIQCRFSHLRDLRDCDNCTTLLFLRVNV